MLRSFGLTAMAVMTIGVSLAVLATFALLVTNLRRLASDLGDEVGLSAYLAPEALAQGRALCDEAETWPGVDRVWVMTSSAALADFRTQLGPDAVLLEGLPSNIIPPSVEVRLDDRPWSVKDVSAIAERLRTAEGVDDVRYGQEDIERVAAVLKVARAGALVLGVALCLATVLVIYNTIRLTLYARRDEIEIMSLVGATASFVRTPFILEGAIQGSLGGGAALGLIFALREFLLVNLEQGLTFARGTGVEIEFVTLRFGASLILFGAVLGVAGSLLAVGKFLRFKT